MFQNKPYIYIVLLVCMTLFASCSDSDDGPKPEELTETITLLIAAPQGSGTRAVGDPGEPVQEGEDWNQLAIILAYTEVDGEAETGNLPVVLKNLSKEEFERLPVYSGTTYRQISLFVRKGKVHIYGVAYSKGADTNLDNAIEQCEQKDEVFVKNLTISNDYASTQKNSIAKFLSVATGYYKNNTTGALETYDITLKTPIEGELAPAIPSMMLTRLATKIDIQWDAQDAYTQGYTDVKVNGFTFYNTNDETGTGKGKGCLFPKLYEGSETLAGQSEFLNTSPISKRNGRVYHYVFPCNQTPHVKFNLSAQKDSKEQNQDYTFQFPGKLQQATWYKINATIRGMTGTTTITLNN